MWHQIKAYLIFLYSSTNQHGIHSPFVYNLITKCFYDKKKKEAYTLLKKYRAFLTNNQAYITITDFGAGSKVFKSNKRKIAAIAKNAGISSKKAKLLNRLIPYLKVNTVLELGTSLGMGSAAMAAGNNNINITTIEGCPETAAVASNAFKTFKFNTVKLYNDTFETALASLSSQKFDLIYIDGNHQKEATLQYFNQLLMHKHSKSIFIFDDIHWSAEMEEAWEMIKKHPEIHVTIDIFYWGFVFFRKEQAKEDFVIRF